MRAGRGLVGATRCMQGGHGEHPPPSFAGHACSPEPPPLAIQAVLSRVPLEGGVHHKRLLLAPALQAGQVHGASVGGLAQ